MQAARDATRSRHPGECAQAEGAATVYDQVPRLPCDRPASWRDRRVGHSQEDEVAPRGDARGVRGEFHVWSKRCRQGFCPLQVLARDRSHAVPAFNQSGGEGGPEPSGAHKSDRLRDRAACHGCKQGTLSARRQRPALIPACRRDRREARAAYVDGRPCRRASAVGGASWTMRTILAEQEADRPDS